MKALLGKKIGMSQVFSEETGAAIPVTLIHAVPNVVTIRRDAERDGYIAVQLALPKTEEQAEQKSTKRKTTPRDRKRMYAASREFRGEVDEGAQQLDVSQFEPGDTVQIAGVSKGKGFAGSIKRHNFHGGPASHGHRHVLRQRGSIGDMGSERVYKGTKMPGRMGNERVTVKNLEIVSVDPERNVVAVKGAVPGPKGGIVELYQKPAEEAS